MSEVKLTVSQQAVVDNDGGALLVSAAAGSGKTKVLVDRLMKRVCDASHPADIDEFLIITYTKAAAAELRAKISKEISERLAADPENLHLQRQSAKICLAQISTVHAFCTSILRTYAYTLDISADFRVAEENELRILSQTAMEDVLDEAYTQIDDDLRQLVDRIGYGRDDRRLGDVLLRVYNAVRCRVHPDAWMRECEEIYNVLPSVTAEESRWGQYLIERLHKILCDAENTLRCAIETAHEDANVDAKYTPTLLDNLYMIQQFKNNRTWDAIYENRNIPFMSLSAVRKTDNPQCKERVKMMRETALDAVKDALSEFYAPSEKIVLDLISAAGANRALLRLVRRYDERFTQEKRRKHLLDFSDLEHEAIRLLTTRDGRPTEAAKEIAEHFKEILVDEYQDSNAVQEYIFEAISREGKNRFMVGDVKQSIYRFRLADPRIFLEKYNLFKFYDAAENGEPRKILLSENFRSRPEILQAANDVFSLVMNESAAEMNYTEEEALKCGGKFGSVPQAKVELHCISTEDSADDETVEKADDEAAFVASRISSMIRERTLISDAEGVRPVQAGDIVILMRAPGSVAHKYADALAAYGIASVSEQGSSVLSSTEGEVLCAMMQIIDNPHRDVAMVTAMCSPIFMFTPNDLAAVRAKNKDCDLYDALLNSEEHSEKMHEFLKWLKQMRELSRTATLREVFDAIMQTTSFEEIFGCMPDGLQRGRTVSYLRTLADSVSQMGGGLSQFNRTIEQMLETDTVPILPKINETANAVRIMSIHKSKGLEFPVVFLADLSRRFNLADRTDAVLLDDELGIGCNVVDTENKSYYPSIAKLAIGHKMTAQSIAEEMRVLYVAMTRAKDMLVMTCCGAYVHNELVKWNTLLSDPIRQDVPAMAKCLGDWVLMTALCRTEAGALFAIAGSNNFSSVHQDAWVITMQGSKSVRISKNAQIEAECGQKIDANALCAPLHERYAFEAASSVPSKLTATQLKGRGLDHEASAEAQTPIKLNEKAWRQAEFSKNLQLTASERGSAMHLFMQHLRLTSKLDRQSVELELQRMVDERFLTPMQADAINVSKVEALFTSDIGRRILSAKDLHREFKFSILTDAKVYYPEAAGEQVMLQGVVDCFWIEDDALVIVDFKTDRIFGDLDAKTENYRLQIETYANALCRIFNMPVKEKILYFFDADTAVSVS